MDAWSTCRDALQRELGAALPHAWFAGGVGGAQFSGAEPACQEPLEMQREPFLGESCELSCLVEGVTRVQATTERAIQEIPMNIPTHSWPITYKSGILAEKLLLPLRS